MNETFPVRFGLVGIGGYGSAYVNSLLKLEKEGLAQITSLVIRTPGKYPVQEKLLAGHSVPIRASLEEMLDKDKGVMDIVAIPTGIESHRGQMIQAVEAGFDVVLEKPTTATIQDFEAMEAALQRTGRFCQIGFQMQSAPNVLALKREICNGRLGQIKEAVVRGFWMRDNHYYARNPWAGKLRSDKGYILDGTINNPMAHYLFNGLYFASQEWGRATLPTSVCAELYQAHEITGEDTACLEAQCANGARVYFYGTLVASASTAMRIEVIGAKGRATWDSSQTVKFYEGEKETGELTPHGEIPEGSLRNAARYLRGLDKELNSPLAMTRAHVLAVNGAFLSARRPARIPASALTIREESKPKPRITTIINGIEETIARAAAERKLFSDIGVPWAVETKPVDVSNLKWFDLAT